MKFLYILLTVTFAFFMASCYEDKGNYDYHDIVEVDSLIIPGTENNTQLKPNTFDTLRLSPRVVLKNGEDGYSTTWLLYYQATFLDTIGKENNLEWIVDRPATTGYSILVGVKMNTTGVTFWEKISMAITSKTNEGWYVLKTIDGGTDIDFFSSDSTLTGKDILYKAYGKRLEGEARVLAYFNAYYDWNQAFNYDGNRTIQSKQTRMFLASEKEVVVYNTQTAWVTRWGLDQIVYSVPSVSNVQRVFRNGLSGGAYMVNAGKVYLLMLNSGSDGFFGTYLSSPDGLDKPYELSEYTVGYSTVDATLYFDKTSSSFWWGKSATSKNMVHFSEGEVALKNMPYSLLYMGTRLYNVGTTTPTTSGYALLKHKTNGTYKMLEIDNLAKDTYPVKQDIDVPASSELVKATLRAQHQSLNAMFYIHENSLKSHNFYNNEETAVEHSGESITFPSDEKVVFLQPDRQGNGGTNLLFVGTTKGSAYKVYVYAIDRDAARIAEKRRVYEGIGVPAALKGVGSGKEPNMSN